MRYRVGVHCLVSVAAQMKIGELAEIAGVPVVTVRHYETSGLLKPAQRTESGYRVYGPSHVVRLRFIRQCRGLGVPLEELKAMVDFMDTGLDEGRAKTLMHRYAQLCVERSQELLALRLVLEAGRSPATAASPTPRST